MAPSLASSLSAIVAPSLVDGLADDLTASYELFDDQADDQTEAIGASFVPLSDDQAASYERSDDLADAIGAGYEPVADD